jgi:hypothetical protein
MLTEIAKLDAVRAAGLPDAAKASSQRPQATLVTQPKIAAPCEDGPGDTAERPFGFGRDGQPADPGVAPDRRVRARLSTSLAELAAPGVLQRATDRPYFYASAPVGVNLRFCRVGCVLGGPPQAVRAALGSAGLSCRSALRLG